jgi:hypothetical protein
MHDAKVSILNTSYSNTNYEVARSQNRLNRSSVFRSPVGGSGGFALQVQQVLLRYFGGGHGRHRT